MTSSLLILIAILTGLAALAENVIGLTGLTICMIVIWIIEMVFVGKGQFVVLELAIPLIVTEFVSIVIAITLILKIQSDSIFSAYFGAIFDIM